MMALLTDCVLRSCYFWKSCRCRREGRADAARRAIAMRYSACHLDWMVGRPRTVRYCYDRSPMRRRSFIRIIHTFTNVYTRANSTRRVWHDQHPRESHIACYYCWEYCETRDCGMSTTSPRLGKHTLATTGCTYSC